MRRIWRIFRTWQAWLWSLVITISSAPFPHGHNITILSIYHITTPIAITVVLPSSGTTTALEYRWAADGDVVVVQSVGTMTITCACAFGMTGTWLWQHRTLAWPTVRPDLIKIRWFRPPPPPIFPPYKFLTLPHVMVVLHCLIISFTRQASVLPLYYSII